MLSRWPIRYKLLFGVAMLVLIVATLSFSGIRGVSAYRQIVRSISRRATELPLAAELTRDVDALRFVFSQLDRSSDFLRENDFTMIREEFRTRFLAVHETLRRYKAQLANHEPTDSRMGDNRSEWETVEKIEQALTSIEELNRNEYWVLRDVQIGSMAAELDQLHKLAGDLPSHLQKRMHTLQSEVRGEYRALIVLSWMTSVLSIVMLLILGYFFHTWVLRPLRVLIEGSRRVARGNFSHRIHLDTHDEVAELAAAMNDMTMRFQEIRDDLDRQVKQRTKEVVRSEQLASVGFLAAGVAHEINNPLASIAWSAEALESRLEEVLQSRPGQPEPAENIQVAQTYLRRIQKEAFRCKGITEGLLDFSRLGDVEQHDTNLQELILDVVDMVRHLGKYKGKTIQCDCDQNVIAPVQPQEIKQVVLNLVTNALDSLGPDGTVHVRLRKQENQAELLVSDNGCGMTEEVMEHLFEPFFTRRRNGQGTGLGLSITYRIVTDHGGTIEASSQGPGNGSQLRVTLPLVQVAQGHEEAHQAA